MAWLMVLVTGKTNLVKQVPRRELGFICLSGLATGASWLCYYRALQDGPASVVVPIDKLSILVTVAFSYLVFHERLTARSGWGAGPGDSGDPGHAAVRRRTQSETKSNTTSSRFLPAGTAGNIAAAQRASLTPGFGRANSPPLASRVSGSCCEFTVSTPGRPGRRPRVGFRSGGGRPREKCWTLENRRVWAIWDMVPAPEQIRPRLSSSFVRIM